MEEDYNLKRDEYIYEFSIPKKDNLKVKRKFDYHKLINRRNIIILFIIITIIIIGVIFLVWIKSNFSNKDLRDIVIKDNEYYPEFSSDIYDYYLLTTDEEITISCKISKSVNVTGCDETINLANYAYYIHEIVLSENDVKTMYKIYIKVQESDREKGIVIESIDGVLDDWTKQSQTININAKSDNEIVGYSVDNGLTWQQSNMFQIEENDNLKIIIKDSCGNQSAVRQESITNIDKNSPIGIIIKEKSSTNEIVLKVIAKDEESGLDSYSWNGEEYSNSQTLTVQQKGTYYVQIRDKAGNVSEKISIEIKDSDFNSKTQYSATFYTNGSTSISNDFLSCTISNETCNITLPSIERKAATILGWSDERDAHTAKYQPGEKITLSEDIILYAVTQKDLVATFDKNGATEISSNKESCTLYNDDSYCYVTAPNIVYSGGKIIGWNTLEAATTVLESPKSLIKLYDDTIYYALVYKELVVSFNINGADSISSTKEVCHLSQGNTSCFIKIPTIVRDGADILGWSTSKDETSADVLIDTELEVNKNMTYYAITKKNITITFDSNGADSTTDNELTCSMYNEANSCEITTPKIYRTGAIIVGWSSNKNSKESELSENSTITVKKNQTYYAITYKKVTISFNANGADTISAKSSSCSYYNAEDGCSITMPNITRSSWTVLGWNTSKDATEASAKESEKIIVKDSVTYYAITYKKVTATFNKNTADSLGNCSTTTTTGCTASCNIYNLNISCEVQIPYIYSTGNEVQYFSTSSNSTSTTIYTPAKKLNLYSNITLYAIVENKYRASTYSIIKTKNYGYTAFETETNCPSSVYNNYYTFVDKLYKKAPYIFVAAKVTFTGSSTFQTTWGNYAGMTYGSAIGYRNVDVKCPTSYSDYYLQTIVHELAHSWDSYFNAKMGYSLSSASDFKNLYTKYSSASTKPLRTYAYSSMAEFVADSYAWYYFLYIDTSYQPSVITNNKYYPNDLKTVVEKYIKIAKNGYI